MEIAELHPRDFGALVIAEVVASSRSVVRSFLERYPQARTRETYFRELRKAAALLRPGSPDVRPDDIEWWQLGNGDLQRLQARLVELHGRSTTVRKAMAAVKGVIQQAAREGLITYEVFARLTDLRLVPVGRAELPGRMVDQGELRKLVGECLRGGSAAGFRDAAACALLAGAGLRRTEAVTLSLLDWFDDEAMVRVVGKGGKERLHPVPDDCVGLVRRWLEVRTTAAGWLLCRVERSGKVSPGVPVTGQALYGWLNRRAAAAGIVGFSPHDLRRTFATQLLDQGEDIALVQKLMGHSSPATTVRYDRRRADRLREAVNRLDLGLGGAPG